jgi:hypothetical protein
MSLTNKKRINIVRFHFLVSKEGQEDFERCNGLFQESLYEHHFEVAQVVRTRIKDRIEIIDCETGEEEEQIEVTSYPCDIRVERPDP